MAGFDAEVQQAISALKAGRRDEARDLLLHVVDQDERNEHAWLYLSALVETLEEQEICLENVLALNPSNQKAMKGLETIRRRAAPPTPPISPPRRGVPPSPPPPTTPPAVEENPYSDQSFDEWLKSAAPAHGPAPQRASDTPANSVDWSRDKGPVVYGSGQQVPLPSSQEYDDWVQGLNLDERMPPAPTSADEALGLPTAPRPDMRRSGPFADRLPPQSSSPPAGELTLSDLVAPSIDSPAGAPPSTAPDATDADNRWVASAPDILDEADPFEGRVAETVRVFEPALGAAPSVSDTDWLGQMPAEQRAPALAVAPADVEPARSNEDDYYRYIPAEIEPPTGGSRRLLLTVLLILLLVALNIISYAYWLA